MNHDRAHPNRETTPGVRQEPDRIRSRPVLASILGAVLLGALGVMWAGLQISGRKQLYRPAGVHMERGRPVTMPAMIGGINQTLIGSDSTMLHLNRQKQQLLGTFEWINEEQGIARIPIEQAMDAIVRRQQ